VKQESSQFSSQLDAAGSVLRSGIDRSASERLIDWREPTETATRAPEKIPGERR